MTLFVELSPFLLAYAGFTLLSLVMDRHRRQLWPSTKGWQPRIAYAMRSLGGLLLILSLWRCLHLWGMGIGLVAWFGVLTLVVFVLIMQITYFPKPVVGLAIAAMMISTVSVFI